jgi:hypothetical protein
MADIPNYLDACIFGRAYHRQDARPVVTIRLLFYNMPPNGIARRSNPNAAQSLIIRVGMHIMPGGPDYVEALSGTQNMARTFKSA